MKWDTFVTRKGGMNNTLAPIKTSTNVNDTLARSSPSPPPSPPHSPPTELHRLPKLDAIPSGKHEEEPTIEERPTTEERPQSPTPEQQEQRKLENQQHVKDEENKLKDLLKGKPIIFIGGGPGNQHIYLTIIL